MEESTHYQVMGLAPTASQDEIDDQYRALAKVVHPDVGGDTVMFQILHESYEVLSDPARRAAYDRAQREAAAARRQPTGNFIRAPRTTRIVPAAQAPPAPGTEPRYRQRRGRQQRPLTAQRAALGCLWQGLLLLVAVLLRAATHR